MYLKNSCVFKDGILSFFTFFLIFIQFSKALGQEIYHDSWIDFNKNGEKDIYEDPKESIDRRVEDLISQMNLNEKTCQMATLYGYGRVLKDELPTPAWKNEVWKDGIANIDEHLNGLAYHKKAQTPYSYPFSSHAKAINKVQKWFIEETRLGIPVDFTNEGIRGLNHDRATPLPAPIAMGSTWDKNIILKAGKIIGREAKALGYTNVYAPILDLARDPRWGRVVETYGEDPFLVAQLGTAMARGIQENVGSTLKHYAVYSIPKGGRDGHARTDPHVAPRELHQLYLYPFRQVIQKVDVAGVMSSYNDWDGIPVSASEYFLTYLLRKKFGFDGYVVSDSDAVKFIYSKHHVASSFKDGVKQAVLAGLNVRTTFNSPEVFIKPLRELVNEGQIPISVLDQRVREVLNVKFKMGLFDHPLVEKPDNSDTIVNTTQNKNFVDQISRESLVLLKNQKDLLPLNRDQTQKILVTGPMATEVNYAISRYGPSNIHVTSLFEGINSLAGPNITISYSKGCDIVDENWPQSEILTEPLTLQEKKMIKEAVSKANEADVVIVALGESEKQVGESKSRTSLDLPGKQLDLLKALYATGKPIILTLINGRALTINWADKYVPAIIESWFPGASGGKALAEAIFGDYNPGGKLPVTFPKSIGQLEYNFPFKPASQAGQSGKGPNGSGSTRVLGALYPFGYGLSYTDFEYKNLMVQLDTLSGKIKVKLQLSNIGKRKGDEVVQLYVKDIVSSVTTYDSQLRGFERVTLDGGESREVTFTLTPDDLALMDKEMQWRVESGKFQILIGSSSEDIKLKSTMDYSFDNILDFYSRE